MIATLLATFETVELIGNIALEAITTPITIARAFSPAFTTIKTRN